MTLDDYKEQINELILRYGRDTELIIHKVDGIGGSHAVDFNLIKKSELVYIPDSDEVEGGHFLRMKI